MLSTTQSGQVRSSAGAFELIPAAFTTKTVNTDFAPKNAYIFKSQNDLNNYLNNMVVQGTYLAGDIVRTMTLASPQSARHSG